MIYSVAKQNYIMDDWLIDFFNGSLSGIGNCLSGYVFDTLKVRMQLDDTLTMTQAFKNIVKTQGHLQLFNGIYYPLITIPLVNSVVFGTYQLYKKIMNKQELSFIDGIQNGAFAGFANSFVVSPVELIKCKMQNDKQKKYTNSKHCLTSLINQNGIKGLFRGLYSTIARQIPGYAAQFATYEYFKCLVLGDQKRNLTVIEGCLIGGFAGINCWLFSYPQDLIKTKLQVQPEGTYRTNKLLFDGGFFDCGNKIYKRQGFKGLWRGIQPCLFRAFVANAIGIAIYEKAQQYHKQGKKLHDHLYQK